MLTVGSLFSGIGGFDLGLERAGFTIKWQVEIDDYCRKVLRKHWPSIPCHADIKQIDWRDIPAVDLVCGGFPCQPFSLAGKRRGAEDDRYLWPKVVRCLSILKPTWFLGENVPGLIGMGLDQVLTDMESIGYEVAPPLVIPACAVDARHRRDRIWIICRRTEGWRCPADESFRGSRGEIGDNAIISDPDTFRCEEQRESFQDDARRELGWVRTKYRSWWASEPDVGRVVNGFPGRVDRLRGLGNAIVPQIAEALGRMIMEVEQCRS